MVCAKVVALYLTKAVKSIILYYIFVKMYAVGETVVFLAGTILAKCTIFTG